MLFAGRCFVLCGDCEFDNCLNRKNKQTSAITRIKSHVTNSGFSDNRRHLICNLIFMIPVTLLVVLHSWMISYFPFVAVIKFTRVSVTVFC